MDTLDKLNKELPLEKTNVEDLVGKQFKRNKYGLSTWTDTISYVGYTRNLLDRETSKIEMYLIGTRTKIHYSFDEILILNKFPLHKMDELVLAKRDFRKRVQNEK